MSRMHQRSVPRFPRRFERYKPAQASGNLYYVRLRTPVGPLYKLGYTTLDSARKRLAYRGTGDDQLIDRELFFRHFENAADIEEAVHEKFSHKAAFREAYGGSDMPLYGNGQSELYADDILEMDSGYTAEQGRKTKVNIARSRYPELKELTPQDLAARRDEEDATREFQGGSALAYEVLRKNDSLFVWFGA